ncbi:uncharacterized protein LOC135366579 [Ornithodoros turicata]|uniref:uncharacterized protein LOC135366579 n=1 Tax=Ornithodoros turicata TaxID=34597 RepID=UPI003139A099
MDDSLPGPSRRITTLPGEPSTSDEKGALPPCSFGPLGCHQRTATREISLRCFGELTKEQRKLICLRTRRTPDTIADICAHHLNMYWRKYMSSVAPKSCINPLHLHTTTRRGTKTVTITLCERFPHLSLVPGNRICPSCYMHILKTNPETAVAEQEPAKDSASERAHSSSSSSASPPLASDPLPEESTLDALNASLGAVGETPVRKDRSYKRREPYVEKKLKKIQNRFKHMISKNLNVKPRQELDVLSREYRVLLSEIKTAIQKATSRGKKVSLLTLASKSWTKRRIMRFFGVTERMVRRAKKLREEAGILPDPSPKLGRPLSDEIKTAIIDFYNSDDISYSLPGKKDVLQGHQKRILLMNLREAYRVWKNRHPDHECGFSTFAALRPKWCVIAGAPGTHSVCVCVYHQNIKLLIRACGLNEDYRELLRLVVCNTDKHDCMMGKCSSCPGSLKLKEYLEQREPFSLELDSDLTVQQWVHSTHFTLDSITIPKEEILDRLSDQLSNLKSHHYTLLNPYLLL